MRGGGVSRYDGQSFTTLTAEDGLADCEVLSILQDRDGYFWFGTFGGVSRYDGQRFTAFTTDDGLADNWVRSILQDRDGNLWFATACGVSRYDGQSFATFTTGDGLADNGVWSIFQDREGHLWFGTGTRYPESSGDGGGVSRYDGQAFTTLTTEDGLVNNTVWSIFQDRDGQFWFGTEGGVSR